MDHNGAAAGGDRRLPGSDGEHALQLRLGTRERAERFYDEQVLDYLNDRMREFVAAQEMFFLATSDRYGECDNSFRAGPPGFLHVVDERTLVFPEYRGNGVHASLGNIAENPHAALLLIDFERARIGLHINGRARIVPDAEMRARHPELPEETVPGRRAQVWVRLEVEEAYIHCAKHIPRLAKVEGRAARERDWGTDDYRRKGGDFFGAAREAEQRRARGRAVPAPPPAAPAAPAAPEVPAAPAPPPVAPAPAPDAAPEPVPAAAAPPPVVSGPVASAPAAADAEAWRAQARRALEEAERRGAAAPSRPEDWFSRR